MDILKAIQPVKLINGGNQGSDLSKGLCLMEMVSYFAADPVITDHPRCASSVLTDFGISLNDNAPSQKARDTLKPLIFKLMGSNHKGQERKRDAHLSLNMVKRVIGPWLKQKSRSIEIFCIGAGIAPSISIKTLAQELCDARDLGAVAVTNGRLHQIYGGIDRTDHCTRTPEAFTLLNIVSSLNWCFGTMSSDRIIECIASQVMGGAGSKFSNKIFLELRAIFEEAIDIGKHGEPDPVVIDTAKKLLKDLKLRFPGDEEVLKDAEDYLA